MERDKEIYERQIKIVDAQIDRLVYELYGMTEGQIEIVGGKMIVSEWVCYFMSSDQLFKIYTIEMIGGTIEP